MKKNIICLLLVLILIITILCLKITMVEYFSDSTKEFKKVVRKLEKRFKTDKIKQICKREYENCLNSEKAKKKLIKIFNEEDFIALSLLTSPKEIVELRDCAIKNMDLLSF